MNNNNVQLKPVVELSTEAAINIRNFFGKTTAALDEIGIQNIIALENAIAGAVIDEKSLLEKVVDDEVKIPDSQLDPHPKEKEIDKKEKENA